MSPIISLSEFEELKRQGKGYFIITDIANTTKIHNVTCSFVNSSNFMTKVIDNNSKNGEYYWVEKWDSFTNLNESPCKKCMD